jgi:hypothetical protein
MHNIYHETDTQTQQTALRYSTGHPFPQPHFQLYPTTIKHHSHYFTMNSSDTPLRSAAQADRYPHWDENAAEILTSIPQFYNRLLGVHLPNEAMCNSIKNATQDVKLVMCSDGSKEDNSSAHGWVISTSSGTILAQGSGPVDGHPDLLSSFLPVGIVRPVSTAVYYASHMLLLQYPGRFCQSSL